MSEHNNPKESEGSSATKARGAEEWRTIYELIFQVFHDAYGLSVATKHRIAIEISAKRLAAHNSATAAKDESDLGNETLIPHSPIVTNETGDMFSNELLAVCWRYSQESDVTVLQTLKALHRTIEVIMFPK